MLLKPVGFVVAKPIKTRKCKFTFNCLAPNALQDTVGFLKSKLNLALLKNRVNLCKRKRTESSPISLRLLG